MKYPLSAALLLVAAVGVVSAMGALPDQWGEPIVARECEQFDRGNVRPDPGMYGPQGWAIMNAEKMPNYAEYDFETPGGWFQLLVRYAALDARPVALSIDGDLCGDICLETTGAWKSDTARWFPEALVHLDAGKHVLRLQRTGPIPHIDCWALAPVDIDIERGLEPDGTWSLRVTPPPGRSLPGLEVGGRRRPADTRVLPGARVWLPLTDPDLRVGPLMLPNLSVHGRLRAVRGWVDDARECLWGLDFRIGAERAQHVADALDEAQRQLDACAAHLQTESGQGTQGPGPGSLLEQLRTIEQNAREPVYIACGSAGHAHLALRKTGYHTLVGNQLLATAWTSELDEETNRPRGPRIYVPGIASLSFYPPTKLTFFAVSRPVAALALYENGEPLQVVRDENADDWRPHRLHTEYFVDGGGHIAQDICIADDVAVCRLRITGLPESVTARVAGQTLVGPVTGEPQSADGAVSLTLQSGGSTVSQAAAVGGVDDWEPEEGGYSAPIHLDGDTTLTIAATIHPDAATARRRVAAAVAETDAFARAEARWSAFFSQTLPRLSCPDARLMDVYYMSSYVLMADRYDMPEGGIWRHPYVVPSKWTWRGIWPEDLSHALTGLRWLNDPETAYGCLRVIRDHFFNPEAGQRSKVHAYGLLTIVTWQLFERYGEPAFIEEMYPTLSRMHAFIAEKTDEDGDGLPAMWDSFMLGWDSSRRFDYGGNLVEHRSFQEPLEPIDAAVYHWRQSVHLAQMAELLGRDDDRAVFTAAAERTRAAIDEQSWDPEIGFYYDLFAADGRVSRVKSCAGLFRLLGGELAPEREQALVDHLHNPDEFWAAYPVPCVAMDEEQFGSVWSGATCLRNNWLVYRGLLDSERDATAAELAQRTLGLLYRVPLDSVNTGYYFDPRTGDPAAEQLGNLFSTPLGGVIDMIMTGVCGLRPSHAGDWGVEPLPSLQPEWWVLDGIAMPLEASRVSGGRNVEPRIH